MRKAVTTYLVGMYIGLLVAYAISGSSIEASFATYQLQDSILVYSLSRFLASGGMLKIISIFFPVMLALIWLPVLFESTNQHNNKEK